MRALVIPAEHEMPRLEDVANPQPQPGQVLVKVAASGINYADTMMRRGFYLQRPKFPFIPGFELSGTVEALGAGVDTLKPGDRVMGTGANTYAEFALAPAAALMPVPQGFTLEEAAAFPVTYLTAMGMLRLSANAQAGETVLIHAAAGGVGTAATQIAKALGLRVIGTASSEAKLELARQTGADFTINYKEQDFVAPVLEATKARGADIILESVGGDNLAKDIAALAPFGRIVVFGMASGKSEPPDLAQLYRQSGSIGMFWMSTLAAHPELMRKVVTEVLGLVASHDLRPVIGKVYPLADGNQAIADLESRRSTGKLLLKNW